MRKPLLDKVGVMYCMIETLLLVCYVGLCVIEPSFFCRWQCSGHLFYSSDNILG